MRWAIATRFDLAQEQCRRQSNRSEGAQAQSCKSGRVFGVEFGLGSALKLTKISSLIRAWDVLFVVSAQKYNQNNLATLLSFADLT